MAGPSPGKSTGRKPINHLDPALPILRRPYASNGTHMWWIQTGRKAMDIVYTLDPRKTPDVKLYRKDREDRPYHRGPARARIWRNTEPGRPWAWAIWLGADDDPYMQGTNWTVLNARAQIESWFYEHRVDGTGEMLRIYKKRKA